MDLETIRLYLRNPMDSAYNSGHGSIHVEFCTRRKDGKTTGVLVLSVEDGLAKAVSSTCLTTLDWVRTAAAYKRAVEFIQRSGLYDS